MTLANLARLVRRRFPTADGLVFAHGDGDTILWQVTTQAPDGTTVLWNALPDAEEIPTWRGLATTVAVLHDLATALGETGEQLTLSLPTPPAPVRANHSNRWKV